MSLLRSLREIKGLGGLDTVGKAIGPNIKERIFSELAEIIGIHF
jgi:hypothetical protein